MPSRNGETTTLNVGTSYIELSGDRLVVGNESFRRVWRVGADGLLTAESFFDTTTGPEWLATPKNSGTMEPAPAVQLPNAPHTLTLAIVPRSSAVEAESLTAELTVAGVSATIVYVLQVFPGVCGVRMRLRVGDAAAGALSASIAAGENGPSGVEQDPTPGTEMMTVTRERDGFDTLTLVPLHLRLTEVSFRDQTDQHNELVFEREWLLHPSERSLSLTGCLFYVEDILTQSGLIFLKEAPLPHARPIPSPSDLRVKPAERQFTFVGEDASGADLGAGYAHIVFAYRGGTAGRIAAMQEYQRALRPYQPGRDSLFVANTWGDRNRDGRIRAAFMEQEIEAGARLGVDVIQIDDGWQAGATVNSVHAQTAGGVWEGFYAAKADFWSVHPERFPQGLEPLVAAARAEGMRFGLWFAPDSTEDFANHRRDAETILRLHREYGISAVKIDGVKQRTKTGERNLRAFFDHVLTETAGKVVFDLDITAEIRPGYFGLMDVGPLFVENRYTDWHKYWPYQTLRNLWKLAHHIAPSRLRMEWLNHDRHLDRYAGDPLAPGAYRPDYLFATVMFAAPLGWFELSSLPESYVAEAAPLIDLWKTHRDALYTGTILPLGDAPDGTAWTGFLALESDGSGAYLLLFREFNTRTHWSVSLSSLPEVSSEIAADFLAGNGMAALLPGGVLRVTIDEPQRFLFARLSFRRRV